MSKVYFFQGDGTKHNYFGAKKNITHIGNGLDTISIQDIPEDKASIVIMNMHGNVTNRKIFDDNGKSKETARSSMFKENKTDLTIDHIFSIYEKLHPSHFEIISCHNGSLLHDIKRNLNKFDTGTTFTILSGSKHSTSTKYGKKYIEDAIEDYSKDPNQSKSAYFAKDVQSHPNTKLFIEITRDKVTGEKSFIAFKGIGPKKISAFEKLEDKAFFGSVAKHDPVEKSHHDANIVILQGSEKDESFNSTLSNITDNLDREADPWHYSSLLLSVASAHDNFEMVKHLYDEGYTLYLKEAIFKSANNDSLDITKFLLSNNRIFDKYYKELLEVINLHTSPKCFDAIYEMALNSEKDLEGIYESQLNTILSTNNLDELKIFLEYFPMDLFQQKEFLIDFIKKLSKKPNEFSNTFIKAIQDNGINLKDIITTSEGLDILSRTDIKIDGQLPVLWAIDNNIKIDNQSPLIYLSKLDAINQMVYLIGLKNSIGYNKLVKEGIYQDLFKDHKHDFYSVIDIARPIISDESLEDIMSTISMLLTDQITGNDKIDPYYKDYIKKLAKCSSDLASIAFDILNLEKKGFNKDHFRIEKSYHPKYDLLKESISKKVDILQSEYQTHYKHKIADAAILNEKFDVADLYIDNFDDLTKVMHSNNDYLSIKQESVREYLTNKALFFAKSGESYSLKCAMKILSINSGNLDLVKSLLLNENCNNDLDYSKTGTSLAISVNLHEGKIDLVKEMLEIIAIKYELFPDQDQLYQLMNKHVHGSNGNNDIIKFLIQNFPKHYDNPEKIYEELKTKEIDHDCKMQEAIYWYIPNNYNNDVQSILGNSTFEEWFTSEA